MQMSAHRSLFKRLIMLALLVGVFSLFSSSPQAHAASAPSVFGLHTSGNRILNQDGVAIRPLGVNRSGTEYMCIYNAGIFDGPSDAASVDAMASWHINAVRVPLNEDCWLAINGAPAADAGANYQQAIVNYVNLLNSRNIIPILDLHWNAAGTTQAKGQQAMPDLDHSVDFWTSVAQTFKGNTSVIFDLYNEPYPSSWDCWRNGSTAPSTAPCADVNFAVAGMQTLVTAIRSTGATNVLMLGGLGYANWIHEWVQSAPTDPQHNLVASDHTYNFSGCVNESCVQLNLDATTSVPVVFGELGENDCQHTFVDNVMNLLDRYNAGYLGWAWDTYDCNSFPSLISDYNGTPTQFGLGFKNHFTALALAGLEGYGNVASNSGYFGEDQVLFSHTVPLTNVVITITVSKDTNLRFNSAYTTIGNNQFAISHTETATQIVYTFTQTPGAVLPPGNVYGKELVAAQYNGNGGTHSTNLDTFVVTAQANGNPVTLDGNISW